MELLSVENLTFTYPLAKSPSIEKLSFSVERGEFVTIAGATGSGKSTLLRMLKRELTPLGIRTGSIRFAGTLLEALSACDAASRIGYVMQRPEQQIVTDQVWHELAFGLENLGIPQRTIARRIAEMASYFGIEPWFDKSVSELSGGQKQLLNLAAVMVMQPELLILDEPTAQLDPIAAADFIRTLRQLNQDFSLTMLIVEHRLEDCIPLSDRVLVLEQGRLRILDAPRAVIAAVKDTPALHSAMPAPARVWSALQAGGACPLTIREGRQLVERCCHAAKNELPEKPYVHSDRKAIECRDVFFRYDRRAPDVLKGLSLTVYEGELFCMLGGNGSGKSTLLSVLSGLHRPHSGSIRIFGKALRSYQNQTLYQKCLAMLPQDAQTVFLHHTVREELAELGDAVAFPIGLSHLYDKHPYDLSGGEQQLVALAKVLALRPRLLLLDEPTKGLDAGAKQQFISILRSLQREGTTILLVTHDVELAALCADRCALFFNGSIVSEDTPQRFFYSNSFYTTAVSRMTRGLLEGAVTVEDVVQCCGTEGEEGPC